MSNYIGVRCPVCNKKFTQSDDIVVCPVCGAPHHRDCYSQKGVCAFAEDHLSGMEWRAPPQDQYSREQGPEKKQGSVSCPFCHASNTADMIFCQSCGSRMSNAPPPYFSEPAQNSWGFPGVMRELDPVSLMYGGVSPDDTIGGESVRDVAAYIGENSAYYLPRFKSMDENSSSLSFNFSALIFGFLYFFHRKMHFIGVILLILFLIGAIPSFFQAREMLPQVMYNLGYGPNISINQAAIDHYQSLVNVTGTINFLIGLIISLCANRFYYSKALGGVKKMRENRGEQSDAAAYSRALSLKGGVSKAAVLIAIGVIMAGYFISASYLYYNYMLEIGGLF